MFYTLGERAIAIEKSFSKFFKQQLSQADGKMKVGFERNFVCPGDGLANRFEIAIKKTTGLGKLLSAILQDMRPFILKVWQVHFLLLLDI